MELYHIKLGNWQVMKVLQIDIAHQSLDAKSIKYKIS